ncbi:MAG TPA: helix-turn-helix domain-containing protein [Chloroflexota bacterium]
MTDQTPAWMTIREASLALGVSELTVRRRIKDGRLRHRLINGKYYVDLSEQSGDSGGNGRESDSAETTGADEPESRENVRAMPSQVESARVPRQLRPETTDYSESVVVQRPPELPFDVDALLAEHGRLAAEAGRARQLEEHVSRLTEEQARLRDGLVSLATRNGWLESKLEERESELKLLTDSQHSRSWWKRLFGGA